MKHCVITSAARTAVGAYLESLRTVEAQDLGSVVIQEAMRRSGIGGDVVDQVIFGDVYGYTPNVARCAALLADIPEKVPAFTVDRQCASSLQAVVSGVFEIMAGEADIVVAGGVETMSRMPYYLPPSSRYEGFRLGNSVIYDTFVHGVTIVQPQALYPGLNMGLTAENVAEKYGISREAQDEFALDSQRKAAEAMRVGLFREEIKPFEVRRRKGNFVFDTDEHPRPDTTLESLARLKPAFKKDGTVTPGNASGMNDGASAVVIMRESKAKKLDAVPLVSIVASSSAGVDPALMGLGPVPAIRAVLRKTGLQLEDIDLFEINEAFAAQALGVLRELKIEPGTALYERVNVNGGAIALGHALANSGTRLLTTLIHELKRRKGRYGIVSLCIGGGMGMALLVENIGEQS